MKAKPKKCKSTKSKDFGCGNLAENRKLGLCMSCYPKWLYSTKEGQELVSKHTIPLQKKRDDFVAAKRDYEERKTIPSLLSNAQIAVNAYIRERDKGKPCISCGSEWKPDNQAGHFYSAAKFPRLRFDEENIVGQCCGCNLMKEGNYEMYRMGYESRFGSEKLAEIDEKARQDKLQGVHKWQREDLIKYRKFFTAKLALIKKIIPSTLAS